MSKLVSLEEAVASIPSGSTVALGGGGALTRRPVEFCRALVRAGTRDLHIHHFLGGIETDLLIGAGAVASTNCAYLGLLEFGQAPNFQRAARAGELRVNEYSEFSFIATLKAADMGLPFIPWKSPWGSDICDDLGLKTVKDPYSELELLAFPAAKLDFAVIQVHRADERGYVEAPDEPDLVWDYDYLIARAAQHTIVCSEEIAPPRDPAKVAIVGKEVAQVVAAEGGSWPAGMHGLYEPDIEHLTGVYLPAMEGGEADRRAYYERYVHESGRDAG